MKNMAKIMDAGKPALPWLNTNESRWRIRGWQP